MSALTDQQRDELQRQLLAMRPVLEGRLQASAENTQPVSLDQPIGRLTRMMDAIQQQRMEGKLQQIS